MENKKGITIYYPPQKWLETRAKELDRASNKYNLESKYSNTFKMMHRLENDIDVILKPIEDNVTSKDEDYVRKLINLFVRDSSAKLKLDWARINALIDCDSRNIIGIIDFAVYRTAPEMLHKLARLHCMTMSQAWRELGNNSELKMERNYYSYYYGIDTPKQWKDNISTRNLNLVVQYAYGAEANYEPDQNPYRANTIFYLLPKSELIIWDFVSKYGNKDTLKPIDEIEDNLKVYQGSDFIAQIPVFEGMKTAGIIKAGATKVPVSVAKKMAGLMTLQPLPNLEYTLSDRYTMLANLGAYAQIPESGKRGKRGIIDMAKVYLKAMFEKIQIRDDKALKLFLSESASKISKRYLDMILYSAHSMAETVTAILKSMPVDNDGHGRWVRYDNVINWIEYVEAYETSHVNWLGSNNSFIELDYGNYLYYPDYYGRLKMPVIDGLLQMLASLGLIDYAYEDINQNHQEIRYVRITNAGLWIADRSDDLKIEIPKIDDGLHFDPDTLMITIRDTNSPNYALLEDLTEKISSHRYKITEGALLRGCRTFAELKSREERLKNYILDGAESSRLSILISNLYINVNKVKPTHDVEYYCMDVDPEDKKLHALITGNSQIRKNTLRVEGWKLLVKKSFYPTFLEKLRQAGYLTET